MVVTADLELPGFETGLDEIDDDDLRREIAGLEREIASSAEASGPRQR
jgi:hypothetical protein